MNYKTIEDLEELKQTNPNEFKQEIDLSALRIIKLSSCEVCGSKYLNEDIPKTIYYRRISRAMQIEKDVIDYILTEYKKIKKIT